jgi:hypothetical protein
MTEQNETLTPYCMRRSDVQLGDATDNWEIVRIGNGDDTLVPGDEDYDDDTEDVLAVLQTETLAELFLQALIAKR